jgi:hypothetical protein
MGVAHGRSLLMRLGRGGAKEQGSHEHKNRMHTYVNFIMTKVIAIRCARDMASPNLLARRMLPFCMSPFVPVLSCLSVLTSTNRME